MKRHVANPMLVAASVLSASLFVPLTQAHAAEPSPVVKINESAAKAVLKSEKLRGNMTMIDGAGGNIIVYNSPAGKFIIDSGISVTKDKVIAELKAIGPEPIKYVVNTHYHWDHSDGNDWMQKLGGVIIGTAQTDAHQSRKTHVKYWNFTFEKMPKSARPSIIVKGSKTMKFGGETFVIQNFGNGHTDSDLWVYAKKADTLVLGDIYWNPYYPFIDNQYGGSVNNTIKWVNKALAQITDKTVVIPGHGAPGDKASLVAWRDMLVDVRDKVASLKKQGKSLEEIQATKPTAAYDSKYGGFVIDGNFFTRLVYDAL